MKITDEMLDKIANLARLTIHEHEREKLKQDMTSILDWVEKLNEIDTTSVDPLLHMSQEKNRVREDMNPINISKEDALKNATSKTDDFFIVPKVIEKGK
ncbi:MAG: Asp-tRNA(Asn)/Glu-tRNA(Gln) amidotransferase subunit GatC [Bacteroidota bacterium]